MQDVTIQREYSFTTKDFECVRALVKKNAGIKLADTKREMVYGRLVRRVRRLGLGSFFEYCELLEEDGSDEIVHLVNAITTNLTSFFREPHHFEYLGTTVMPMLLKRNEQTRRIRIWCAGCSTGEEPYSIAMVVKEKLPLGERWEVKILATDIDSNVLNKASRGIYPAEGMERISERRLKRWFRKGTGAQTGMIKLNPDLRDMISFRRLNLMEPWPMRGPFDVVFCRNVVIYFDKSTQKILFDRLADTLVGDGQLFIGHSESLFRVSDRFELLGNTIYRRCA